MAGTYQQKTFGDKVTSVTVMEHDGASAVVGTPTVTVKEVDASGDVTYAVGATVPSNGDAGYAVGCFFKKTTGNVASGTVFVNEGTNLAAAFNALETNDGSSTGNQALQVAHAIYSFAADGGAVGNIVPVLTASIPANAILVAATVNSTTAVTSGGSATVSIGTTAGSSATSILGSTAKTSFTADALLNGAVTFAAPVKMSAAGNVQITVGTAALTAGFIEAFVSYYVAANA